MSADRQIDYLTDQLTRIEDAMIDPQDFGRIQGEVQALRRDFDRLVDAMDKQAEQLKTISETLSEARGGWKLLMLAGGSGALLGALTTKLPGIIGGLIK